MQQKIRTNKINLTTIEFQGPESPLIYYSIQPYQLHITPFVTMGCKPIFTYPIEQMWLTMEMDKRKTKIPFEMTCLDFMKIS
jgi:hypothetical protein